MEIIGYLAGILSVLTFLPQIFKLYRTKSSNDLSAFMIIIFNSSVILWFVYGVSLNNLPMIIANLAIIFLTLIILIMIFIYRKK